MTNLYLAVTFFGVIAVTLVAAHLIDKSSKRRAAVRKILRHTQPVYPQPAAEVHELAWFRPRGAA